MDDLLVKMLSNAHALVYRATSGVVGRRLVGNDMLLLTTTGRRSGRRHTVPLLHLTDGTDYIVIASYGGRPSHPHWYRNLEAEPNANIVVGSRDHAVVATTMSPSERDDWWPRIVEAYSDYAEYQKRTDRLIPVVRLVRAG